MQEYNFDYHQYQKKLNKSSGFFPIVIVLIIVLIGIAFAMRPTKKSSTTLYFVQVNEFLTYKEAEKLSSEIQTKQGAGYIHYDGKYHVLASFYPNYDTANKVVENIKAEYLTAKIYEVSNNKLYNNKSLSNEQNSIVSEIVVNNLNSLNIMYDLLIKYEKDEILESELVYPIKELKSKIDDKNNNFSSKFSSISKYNNSKKTLKSISDNMTEIINIIENQNELYKIKYELISFALNHSYFISYFS